MSTSRQNESFPGRTFYRGTGVNWGRFLAWLVPVFVVAGLLAEGMFQLFNLGQYYEFIVPLLAAAAVSGMVYLAVNLGHCRNRLVAGAVGFGAGFVLYIGSYYCGMVHHLGPETAGRLDLLPTYIRLRMLTDVTSDSRQPEPDPDSEPRRASRSDMYFNWIRFGFEFIGVLALTTLVGVQRSKKAYCGICGRWMLSEKTPFEPAQAGELLEAFRMSSARSLAALCAEPPFPTLPGTALSVEFCPSIKNGTSRDCPVYASVKNVYPPPGGPRAAFDQVKNATLLSGVQLNPDELAAITPRFPMFEAHVGRSAVAALAPKPEPAEADGAKPEACVEITPLGSDHAGKIMTRKFLLLGNALTLGGLLGFAVGVGLLAWGVVMAFPDTPPAGGVAPAAKASGIALISVGGVVIVGVLVCFCIDSSFLGNRLLRNRIRRELARRNSLLVDPNDPEAQVVEIVPKLNWGKMMLDDASDVGLWKVDTLRREVRFEGDKERWRIPAAAITDATIEAFAQGHTSRYFVVIRANHRHGLWEAPVRERRGSLLISGSQKRAARRMLEKIKDARGIRTGTFESR